MDAPSQDTKVSASDTSPTAVNESAPRVPQEPLGRLFLRFLKFGSLAWGGPVAQIAMIRHELVEEEKWVSPQHFNRVLAMYQVLPGPEAHELCVYFGMLARGRIGGILAGLGFMLPGFMLMFILSWLYVRYGLQTTGTIATVFAVVQAAVAALIVRAVHRIGSHVLLDRWSWIIAVIATAAQLTGVHFAITLIAGGAAYVLAKQGWPALATLLMVLCAVGVIGLLAFNGFHLAGMGSATIQQGQGQAPRSLWELFISGLKAGMLTFGGAYTVIPFLQKDAVADGAWMTNTQFLDGLALSGLLPAPLIIFATFVGYLGGGAPGAVALTAGIFLPAFAFTLLAHHPLEKLVSEPRIRLFLEGVTAGVVGLIAGTTIALMMVSIVGSSTAAVFAVALAALFYFKSKLTIPLVVASAAFTGYAISFVPM
ncbi:chromate efflux transporter [Nitrosospira briensis]|uniref:chromate efflux transporter n=1 Tax=Nitrosospira briensis TaxID=35799 RepID=UPI0008E58DBE|nr:chromate efflux transporter [Nitrosospira briensis]SFO36685.1 chromate transporter [Nitrosospira briensis]